LAVIALFASAGVTGALWAEPPTDDRSQLPPVITPVEPQKPVSVDDLRAAAEGAIAQRAWDRADAAYRRMWLIPEAREAGA
jgi:hypothetical protein